MKQRNRKYQKIERMEKDILAQNNLVSLAQYQQVDQQKMCVGASKSGEVEYVHTALRNQELLWERKRKQKMEAMVVVSICVAFAIVLSVLAGMRMRDKAKARALFDNSQYEGQEANYRQLVSDVLQQFHMVNSGLMLTHTADMDGNRAYRMEIYNSQLDTISKEEFGQLAAAIDALAMTDLKGREYNVEIVFTGE